MAAKAILDFQKFRILTVCKQKGVVSMTNFIKMSESVAE